MKAALLQLCSSDAPQDNLAQTKELITSAAARGAEVVMTPEVTNCVSASRDHQHAVLTYENSDPTLHALRKQAEDLGIWILIGSLALKSKNGDGRFVNRTFLISPTGEICAKYDKIHMFDVRVSETETYRESAGYRPGAQAVTCVTPFGVLGLSICYDLRFPALYRQLAQAGAEFLIIPSAFSPVTGAAHWETLLRARAIETGCFVLAPAQTGEHLAQKGRTRTTFGRSMVVGPWGDVIEDAGTHPGVILVDLDRDKVTQARRRIPSFNSNTRFVGPT